MSSPIRQTGSTAPAFVRRAETTPGTEAARPWAIRMEGIGKQFRIGGPQAANDNLREDIMEKLTGLFSRSGRDGEKGKFWALRDIELEVPKGEALGIIGRNGAGKSTLLKVLSRITPPTEGFMRYRGRLQSLLEVGTGFHRELTGRENVYLNGAILGMRRAEINQQFGAIVEFSGVEKFLDTPVKYYSSGMYVRLAFAVAAHLRADILVVDEVLAVGDARFQKKCLGKMQDIASEGRTVCLVSHNMQSISTLTRRAVLLEQGQCRYDGPTESAINEYLRLGGCYSTIYEAEPSAEEPKVTRVEVVTSEPASTQMNGEPMTIRFQISTPCAVDGASLAFQFYNSFDVPIVHLWTFDTDLPMCREPGVYNLVCRIPQLRLYMGNYSITVHFAERAGGRKYQTIEGICPFEVVLYGREREYDWQPGTCAYLEECEWTVERERA